MSEAVGLDARAGHATGSDATAERGYTARVPPRFDRACRHGAYILQAATTLP